MAGHEGCYLQDLQNVEEMDTYDATRLRGAFGGGDQPVGAKSINSALADVVQSGEFIIRVGTIWCSAYSLQRCSESAGF